MFKDYDKFLRESLKVYLFILVIIFILKLVGLDYFGLDVNNKKLISISNYFTNSLFLGDVYLFISVYIQFYFYLCLVCKKRKLYLPTLIGATLNYFVQIILTEYNVMNWVYFIYSFSLMIIIPIIVNKKITIKRQIKYILIITLYQLISYSIRSVGINNNYGNFLVDSLLNIDQLLLLAITYNLYFMKGDEKKCTEEQEVGYSLPTKANLRDLQKKLQKNYSNFKKLNKQEKATIIIYSILSSFWNIFTLVVVLFIAKLNDTFIECIFIITSFWLSKKVFGKPFHLKSMAQCFVVSNITYYVLNRIATPTGISILIPIMLGVGLSYITSKLVKRTYKPLYKGMPKEVFENTILKVVDKDSDKYNICYEYFIEKQNAIYLSHKHNYTEAGIRKITSRVNDDIKALNN